MKRQYSTKQLKAGYKRCRFCDATMPYPMTCKCSVRIRLTGHPDVIESAIGQLVHVFEIIEEDEYFGSGVETAESYLDVVVKAPVPEAFLEAARESEE